jgi:hypothetical protein
MSFENFIRNNYEVVETDRPDMIRINCPFCYDEKHHGYVNTQKNLFKCWKCNWSHKPDGEATTAYYFLKEVHGLSPRDIIGIVRSDHYVEDDTLKPLLERLEDFFDGRENHFIEAQFADSQEMELPNGSCPIHFGDTNLLGNMAWTYIKSRFEKPSSVVHDYNLHYGTRGAYLGHIIIPVYEWGRLTWFQGRVYFPRNREPKYMAPSRTNKPLFNMATKERDLILVEGVFDAMTLGDKAICPFGSNLSKYQFSILKEIDPRRITICFDNDNQGRKSTRQVAKYLKSFMDDVNVVVGLEKDPNALGEKAWDEINRKTVPFDTEAELRLRLER